MDEMIPRYVNRYLDSLVPAVGAAFEEMERDGKRSRLPLIDRQVGNLLDLLCRMTGAARVLEIGTCIGYSTAWLARAVGENGRVYSIDVDPDRSERARVHLGKARLAARTELLIGDAADVLPHLDGPFDLIFNDGDKGQYPMVAEEALRLLRSGGLLVTDNALWDGRAAKRGGDADTKAIRAHNEFVTTHRAFTASLLPVRDGVLVARRR